MGSEARARVGLVFLASVTLLTFNQLFAQQDFVGPSLLGGMAAIGISLLARRMGLWASTTIGLSLAILVWYLVILFEPSLTFYGLPTIGALRSVGDSIAVAYEHSQVDFAPVPLRPGYAILTIAAIWTLVTVGEVATFRWRRPFLAALPAIGLFALLQVVGTQQGSTLYVILFLSALFTYWALESAHRLRSWGRWVPVWRGQRRVEPPEITTGLARKMGASCVAAALILPIFLPALEDGLVSWRKKQGDGLGFGPGGATTVGGAIDPLVSLVPRMIRQTDTELFQVRADEPTYWRLLTLNEFDGTNWSSSNEDEDEIPPTGEVELEPPRPGRTVFQSFRISKLERSALPVGGTAQSVTTTPDRDGTLRYEPGTGDLLMQGVLAPDMIYDVRAVVPDLTYRGLRRAEIADAPDETYLSIGDRPLSPRVVNLRDRWTAAARTDVDKLIAIQEHLRGFRYSLDIEEATSLDYLETFLLDSRVGFCQQFATAFAVLARDLGFPTRVAVGFLPGSTTAAAPRDYTVNGTDTHAWPEVLFEDYGWVAFEPTPRGESAIPSYTLEPAGGNPATITGAEAPLTGARGGQKRGITDLQGVPNNRGVNSPRRVSNRRDLGTGAIDTDWQRTFTRLALVLAIAALLFLGIVPILKRLRVQSRYSRARGPRDQAAAAFAEFQTEAAELASPRAPSESARSYARRVSDSASLPRPTALRLASIYEAAEFGPATISPQVAQEAKRLARQLKARLWSQASWWARMKRLWSPAGLMPRPALTFRRVALQRILSLGRS